MGIEEFKEKLGGEEVGEVTPGFIWECFTCGAMGFDKTEQLASLGLYNHRMNFHSK